MEQLQVRRIESGEQHLVRQVYDAMSPESIYLRFHSPIVRLSRQMLDVLCANVPDERYASVALVDGHPVGHAQWIRDRKFPKIAEIAVAVADPWQRQGIGSALLADLQRTAQASGVRGFACYVHRANKVVRRALDRLGAERPDGRLDEELVLSVPAAAGA